MMGTSAMSEEQRQPAMQEPVGSSQGGGVRHNFGRNHRYEQCPDLDILGSTSGLL
jgi:hypothetical protein